MDLKQFVGRKQDHLRQALNPSNQAAGLSGLDRIHLTHEALPDLNLEDTDLSTACLGRPLATPFYIAAMTAGHPKAARINRTLAQACQLRGWAMGIGSQRRELESDHNEQWRKIRDRTPDLVLFSNIGLSQLHDASSRALIRLVSASGASALAVHANALQEALQPEGTPRFRGALQALRRVCKDLRSEGIPVILKETGCGFSPATLRRVRLLGLAAVDVAGLGGTHWGRIEGARAASKNALLARAAETFSGWGESTVESVCAATAILTAKTETWASGGVRSGLDAAKLIALGAHRVGYAQPALQAAIQGLPALLRWMELQEQELRIALFCTGCKTPSHLRAREATWRRSGV